MKQIKNKDELKELKKGDIFCFWSKGKIEGRPHYYNKVFKILPKSNVIYIKYWYRWSGKWQHIDDEDDTNPHLINNFNFKDNDWFLINEKEFKKMLIADEFE